MVSGGVVRRTGGDAQKMFVCHLWKGLFQDFGTEGWTKEVSQLCGNLLFGYIQKMPWVCTVFVHDVAWSLATRCGWWARSVVRQQRTITFHMDGYNHYFITTSSRYP